MGGMDAEQKAKEAEEERAKHEKRRLLKEQRQRNERLGLVPKADDRELQLDRCVYMAMHKITSESEVIPGEVYLRMSVYVYGDALDFRAYDPVSCTEYECEAPLDMRREYFQSYMILSEKERHINLNVMFVGFCLSDVEGGLKQIVRLLG